ncbi:hypothetical protein BG262_00535 [Floricoccus penangensis]|uniref:Mannosyl-glycoprotein endo-beta-N-acetylglucosamidase-like domain-containing protein n=1 Tax=Floricoccus penangensis TaxID=1859475 RepID=A0A9Q5JI63_9LACT|nr:glucosaminidase domain-containing protein [Floricoccus penangensis]OFI48021.1 hypothetical protein BG262_00535 [Floricoccus penangensis]
MNSENSIRSDLWLKNEQYSISQEDVKLVINAARLYNLRPSFLITQMFVESHWGDNGTSYVGTVDNNWSGISEPFSVPTDLGVIMTRGTARPSNEGGYYVHFSTKKDFFKAYAFLLSKRNRIYNVEGTNTIEAYTKGLFRIGGAKGDYAEAGYDHYLNMMVPTYNAIKQQNQGKLEYIDSITNSENHTEEEDDMFIVTANNRGIALMQGGLFLGFLDAEDPKSFMQAGIPVYKVATKTFDSWQSKTINTRAV